MKRADTRTPLRLALPSHAHERSYRDYIVELGEEERYPFPLDFAHDDFPALLKRLDQFAHGIDLPDGYVSSSTYWLIEGEEIVGVSNLRHRLNDRIRFCGGHIGLGVRPSCRKRGLGNALLLLTLQAAKERGIDEVHIHCHKGNAASSRMILSAGGVLDSEVQEPQSDEVVQRFLVRLADQPVIAR